MAAGLIKNTKIDVKILGSGELTKSLSVTAHGFSKTAKEKIEAAGGTRHLVARRAGRQEAEEAQGEARPRRSRRPWSRPWRSRPPRRLPRLRPTRQPLSNAELARQRLARPGAPAARSLHGVRARDLPARLVDPGSGRRRRGDRELLLRPGRLDPRAPEPLLGRRALAVLALRARDHAVRHGVDHRPADDRRDPAARRAAEGGRVRVRQDQPVHAVPHRRPRRAAGVRLRRPLPAPGCAPGERRPDDADRRLADDGHRAADVARRADHEARHRQRHLDPHLRLDPHEPSARHQRLVERRADGAHLLPADRARDRRLGRVRPGGPAPDPDPVREAAWSAGG